MIKANIHKISSGTFGKQSGAALITGLIFLLILTMLVLSALRSGTLEEAMALNFRRQNVLLQGADALLLDVEAVFGASPFSPYVAAKFTDNCTNGYCSANANAIANAKNPGGNIWETIDWSPTGVTKTFANKSSEVSTLKVAGQPRYIIEIINPPYKMGSVQNFCTPGLARVTVRAKDSDTSAIMVQTMYRFNAVSC